MTIDPAVSAGTTSEQRLRPLQEIHDTLYVAAGYEDGGDCEHIAHGLVDEIELLRRERDQVQEAAAHTAEGLCHWVQNYRGAQAETHWAFHFDNPCPYEVVAAVLRGQPDPRAAAAQPPVDECPDCGQKGRYDGRVLLGGRGVYTCTAGHRWQDADERPNWKATMPIGPAG